MGIAKMNCSEAQNLLSSFYDNELSVELRSRVSEHVAQCAECRAQLAQFETLSSLAAGLAQPEAPASIWAGVEKSLDSDDSKHPQANTAIETAREPFHQAIPRQKRTSYRSIATIAAAIAATVLVVIVGWTLWHGDHDHETMVKLMSQVASEIDSDGATTLLLNEFGGNEVSYQQAITQVGYRPVASKGLPEGYSVESIQVLDMPCCKCTQTACKRADGSRLMVYEHENVETGWFEHRNSRKATCCGKPCTIVQFDNRLAVTWKHDNRHVTLLGIRDEEESELLVKQFESEM
jgi:predicted anti-sigma-YlaC factor YlaD